jgi:hypothetical protein
MNLDTVLKKSNSKKNIYNGIINQTVEDSKNANTFEE